MRPTGKTNTSPLFRVLVKRRFSGLDVTKPTKRVPSKTTRISVPRGWVWGGFSPYGAKSIRTRDMPRVLRPGNVSTFTVVTLDPTLLSVFPGMFNPSKKKSSSLTSFGSLQNFPLMNTT